jgi:hypothetical protein
MAQDDHAGLPQKLTAEELETWIPATQAIQRVTEAYAGNAQYAFYALGASLKLGALRAGADYAGVTGAGKLADAIEISVQHWGLIPDFGFETVFWETGILELEIPGPTEQPRMGYRTLRSGDTLTYVGVRFEPEGLEKIISAAPKGKPPASAPEGAKDKGGRPPREDWDDILAAAAGAMLGGRLIPKRPADVENFMLQWASDNGKPIGTTAVKLPAKKLFEVFKKEVGN